MATIPIRELPVEIDINAVVDQCYNTYIEQILDALDTQQSTLVEVDKLMVVDLIIALRRRNKRRNQSGNREIQIEMKIVDHRAGEAGATVNAAGALTNAVRSFAEAAAELDGKSCAIVVPNFDLLVSSDQTNSHLDLLTRDLMAILHENPDLVLVAFKDPSLNVPKTVAAFFAKKIEIIGIDRRFMPHLITQQEARRIDPHNFDVYKIYKYVSGLNVVRLRKILQGFTAPRYTDGSGESILNEIRRTTAADSEAELPSVPISQIGGYKRVKKILRENVLGMLEFIQGKSATMTARELKAYEKLIPRNILFTGPPGTGKTLFCKALATELNATIFIVNGPELKSKWVGESERAIRQIFNRARKCAPSLIVFDEIDSFARQRSTGENINFSGATSSDNSMLNQLLTEMEGFRPEEMVFVVATTNFSSSLDTALVSRFKEHIEVPYPETEDRREIIVIYDRMYDLQLSPEVIQAIVEHTELWIDQNKWTRFAGRELESLAISLARYRVVESYKNKLEIDEIAITKELAIAEIHKKIKTPPLDVTFDDIGGYDDVKEKLQTEVLQILQVARELPEKERVKAEAMIPRGIIFEGPPGTGKTMFAKALANELDATVTVVHGPELKARFFGESEERIRKIFAEARRNAPSVIVFDEIDSIAGARQEHIGGVENSMVNQLLTEMDGMSQKNLVFVVATTNFARGLDKALKRPGRFEYILHIPYPDSEERRHILSIYNEKYELGLDEKALDHLVFRTDNWVDPHAGLKFSGDHLEAICRSIARKKLIDRNWTARTENLDAVVSQRTKKPLELSEEEETVVAIHEAGHAIVSMYTPGCKPIKRISIASEYDGSLGYVLHEEIPNKMVYSQEELLAEICCLMGGRMAEKILLGKIATGGANDIEKATLMATHLVANFGMDDDIGPRLVVHPMIHGAGKTNNVSQQLLERVEKGVDKIIREQERRAIACIEEHVEELKALRDRLLDKKVVEFQK